MKIRRITALLMSFCLLIPLFASCDKGTTDFVRPDDEVNNDDPAFPTADYGGEDFTFFTLTSSTSTNEYYCGAWIDAENLTGTVTNDAVFKRNAACESRYNVNIVEKMGATGGMDELKQYYMTGDYCFDVVYSWGNWLGAVITDNLFYDFKTMDEDGYINLEADYWCPSTADDLTIAGRRFLAINDISMSKLSWSSCMFYNPQIVEDLSLENPQELVAADNWTIDKFLELVGMVHADLDKDGAFTKEDLYGYIFSEPSSILYGLGVKGTNKAEDGTYTLAIGETKAIDLIAKLKDAFNDKSHVFTSGEICEGADMTGYDWWEYYRSYFAKGHSLFLCGSPELTRELKDMEGGYGVVPMPKYDNLQTEYCSKIDPCAGMFAIPNTCRTDGVSSASFERTGTILEYLAYKSGQEGGVVDAYYETTIKGQRMTIEGNKEMLDIVRDTGHYEWTEIVGLDVISVLNQMYDKNGAASRYRQSQTRLTNAIDAIYDEFLELD